MDKEAIIRKVKALLAKNPANGSTECEAVAALKKAKELMTAYLINESELNDSFTSEQCVFKKITIIKTGYNLSLFCNSLAMLFDTKCVFTSDNVVFFGFEQDAELCVYFYTYVIRACLNEKDRYMNSSDVKCLKRNYHGKTLASEFVKGFQIGMAVKMTQMYEERNKEVQDKAGLVLLGKKNKVISQFEARNIKVRKVKNECKTKAMDAFMQGKVTGYNTALMKGIH